MSLCNINPHDTCRNCGRVKSSRPRIVFSYYLGGRHWLMIVPYQMPLFAL